MKCIFKAIDNDNKTKIIYITQSDYMPDLLEGFKAFLQAAGFVIRPEDIIEIVKDAEK